MRRTRRDLAIGRLLRLGTQWRCRDDQTIWRVQQIYRLDCLVLLEHGGQHRCVAFSGLRTNWILIFNTVACQEKSA